jgi:hypothetical protein
MRCLHRMFTTNLNQKPRMSFRIPRRVVPKIFLSNGLFVYSLHASKAWLMRSSDGKYWTLVRVLVCGGLAAVIWGALKSSKMQRAKAKTEVSCNIPHYALLYVKFTSVVVCASHSFRATARPTSLLIHGVGHILPSAVWGYSFGSLLISYLMGFFLG